MITTREQHSHVLKNREEINNSRYCACGYCRKRYLATEIVKWVDRKATTAICPRCGVDAVLGDACGFELTDELLETIYKEWF